MKIGIIGAGNIGTLTAAEFASRGHQVTIYSRKQSQFSKHLTVYGKQMNMLFKAELHKVTDKIEEAILEQDYIFIITPTFTFKKIAEKILPYVKSGQCIGIVPGSGGSEFAFRGVLEKGANIFGLLRVASVARLEKYGESVHMLGRQETIHVAALPSNKTAEICETVGKLFDLPCLPLRSYTDITFVASNQIMHTARLYTMFKDYKEGVLYPRNYLFYDEWDDNASECMRGMGLELLALSEIVSGGENAVLSEIQNIINFSISDLTNFISHLSDLQGLSSPMTQVESGEWIPDFESRYFTADFSFGLKVLIDIADAFSVDVPWMKKVWDWYVKLADVENCFELEMEKEDVEKIYM